MFVCSSSVLFLFCSFHKSTSKVIELKCDPNFDTAKVHYLPYTCIVGFSCFYENIEADENTNIIINFDETNYSLDCIGFINTTLNEIPSNLFNKYQAVTSVYASYMGLSNLPKNTFENASRLSPAFAPQISASEIIAAWPIVMKL